jgi:hypothetical protein
MGRRGRRRRWRTEEEKDSNWRRGYVSSGGFDGGEACKL